MMKLSAAVSGFLLARTADGYSPATLADYGHTLRLLVEHAGDDELVALDTPHLRTFFAWLRSDYTPVRASGNTSPLSNHTLANAWCAVRSFCKWCAAEGLSAARPDMVIQRPTYVAPEVAPFTSDELVALLAAAEYTATATTTDRTAFRMRRHTAARDRALILVLLDTGLRVSELARLQVADVAMSTGEVTVTPYQAGRKSRGRHVYLGKSTRRALWRYVAGRTEGSLFTNIDGAAMTRNSIRLMLSHLGKRAGVPHTHPHRFRHTFAIEYLRNGGDVFTLQRLLGHSSLDMVRRYVALAQTDVATAHARASPVDRWQIR
jgi:integrase/recombinase XerD